MKFILGSASPRRLELIKQVGLSPDLVISPEVDESPLKKELPKDYVQRIAAKKVNKLANLYPNDIILCADTSVCCGRRILPKPSNDEEVIYCLNLLSGRRHRVYTTVCLKSPQKTLIKKTVLSILRLKHLSSSELKHYVASKEGIGKAGGFNYQGKAAMFVIWIRGSPTNIMGLPLYETSIILQSIGIKILQ